MVSPDERILLVKHNGEDAWALPGGRVDEAEDPARRAVIEVAEETGVHITEPEYAGRYAGTVAVHDVYIAEGSGELRPDPQEIQDVTWWNPDEELDVQTHVVEILEMIADSVDDSDQDELDDARHTPPLLEASMRSPEPVRVVPLPDSPPPVPESLAPVAEQQSFSDTDRSPTWAVVLATLWTWTVIAALFLADCLIWVMLITRSGERRIRPTKRKTWPKGLKQELMRRQDSTCVYCAYRRIARSLDIDHIIPAVRGGSNDPSNLQVICRPCNQRKGDQTDREFRARYSRLVPATPMTPPRRKIPQKEFKEETRRTSAVASAREFRKSRYITPREKILSGCFITGCVVAGAVLIGLSSIGAAGLLLLLPALVLGGAVGVGIWLRAYWTGATLETE